MSILLEALRKSEKSQRPVEAPTIHAEQQVGGDFKPSRKGPLVLLLLAVLLLIAWFVWRQYQPSDDGYQPPVDLPAGKESTITTPVSSLPPSESGAGAGKETRGGPKEQRTPVENFTAATTDTGKESASRPATAPPKPKTRPKTRPKPQPKDQAASKTRVKPQPPAKPAPVENKTPAPISYWELPDSVRADVPEIKFSVLVYASEPGERFVLANGQRLNEGDSLQQGLVVEEIRRDGVVFSYRLYRFLVER